MRKKTMLSFAMLSLALLSRFSVNAQMPSINFTEYDLPNGLHVILHPDQSAPTVVVTVMYHVGSKNENPNRTGFAHFFEHLMFEGTPNIPRGEYGKIVERAGGTLNANTSTDRTYYYELLPPNQLELGLWLESERMLQLKVDSIGIETQRGVVKEEKKERYDNTPYGTFLIESFKRAFTQHPYRWTPIGNFEHLNAASYNEFYEFYKTFYVPNNAVLTIAGNFNPQQATDLISKYFGEIPKGTRAIYRPNIVEPSRTAEIRDTVYDNIQLPGVFITYNMPAYGAADYYAVDMLTTLLSGGESSRFYKTLVDGQQKALFVQAVSMPYEDPGAALVLAVPNSGVDPKMVELGIDSIINDVQTNLIPEAEFEKLRNKFENDIVSNFSTVEGKAEQLATCYTYFKDTKRANGELSEYLKVTREDIQRVAKKYFVPSNRVVLYYMPKKQ
jgi:predicted Zn-dependent peptidase